MKGYKAFDKDLRCKGFQYEIGQTYEIDGDIECCGRGFHFCLSIADCYRFYEESEDTRICKVEALGDIKTEDDIKYCTNKIKILSEVKKPRIKSNTNSLSSGYCNCGAWNNGNWNRGDCNTGKFNGGSYNSGNHNNGYWNSGNHNNGNINSGDWNVGSCNKGSFNSGNHNNGDFNTGEFNSGNCNTGVFNCEEPKIRMFDKETDWTMKDWQNSKAFGIMLDYPYYEYDYRNPKEPMYHEATAEDRQKWWDELTEEDKNTVKSLPNFDADKFYLCTGIRV